MSDSSFALLVSDVIQILTLAFNCLLPALTFSKTFKIRPCSPCLRDGSARLITCSTSS